MFLLKREIWKIFSSVLTNTLIILKESKAELQILTQLRKNQEQSLNKNDSQDARPRLNKTVTKGGFNMMTHYLDFFSPYFLDENVKTT